MKFNFQNKIISVAIVLYFFISVPIHAQTPEEKTAVLKSAIPDTGFAFHYSMLAPPPGPVTDVTAADLPNDPGKAVEISWSVAPGDDKIFQAVTDYAVYRSQNPDSGFALISRIPSGSNDFSDSDTSLVNGQKYYYKVAAIYKSDTLMSAVAGPAIPEPQWFHTKRIAVFIMTIIFCGSALFLISRAQKGIKTYVRPIAGINAVDEAIGRATEMGRPILFVPGLGAASDVATIAAFTILARVSKKIAEYQTRIIVPNYDPVVMAICQEVVKESCSAAGRPESFDQKDVYFLTQDQFPYTAAVNGTMLREKPAANFYLGKFYAESLILAETGFVSGSIQIAGTDELVQIPFFIASCDFTLMGEELYAASAYLSQEPQQLGTLKAQDWGKVVAISLMIAGLIVYYFSTSAGDAFSAWIQGG